MNLFEKIFNHQIISRLEDSGTFMVTSHERAWLKTMLDHPAAADAFTPGTLDKLRSILEPDQVMDTSRHLIEKARSQEQQVYHPLLRPLRRHIMNKTGIRLTYQIKSGRVNTDHSGCPYKLEYSMVKREWYLLWYHTRHHAFMRTRLKNIHSVAAEPMEPSMAEGILKKLGKKLDSRRSEAVIEIIRDYNEELSRILYAFSSFEKNVEYDTENDTYRVRVSLSADELEYLLSKLRFLGKRVRVMEGDYLKRRMLEASTKALDRYGVISEGEELSS
ncbi:putative DNA-binding transcriptional regulator YafY [Paenibacillus forsythiae]|uniref:DNA-binding transcriptional regulator YafY n=1 Tax=Paenibacillus forsythiae TaxID=365616 RepID=A0ABU3HAE5_9BACL|nr:WYL domain-containing protein [Paenibacillus forsythiae]MDT3427780.1 putative DNA-binding transcriptional regulator YafY [Paenibacillus forsythiae]